MNFFLLLGLIALNQLLLLPTMAQKDPYYFVIGRRCKEICNGSKKLRIICRNGQQWCVNAASISEQGDYCGCCKKPGSVTCQPTPRPIPPPIQYPPQQLPPYYAPYNKLPIEQPTSPTGGIPPTQEQPVDQPPTSTSTCTGKPLDCKNPIFCHKPGGQVPTGFRPECLCDVDVKGNPVCWQNMVCDRLLSLPVCSSDSDCANSAPFSKCVQGAECCGSQRYYCVAPCYNPGPPFDVPASLLTSCSSAALCPVATVP